MSNYKLQVGFFTVLISAVLVMSFFVLKPYLSALFLAVIFTIAFSPAHELILRFTGKRENVAAFISVLAIIIFIITPIAVIGIFLFDDIHKLYLRIASGAVDLAFIEQLILPVENFVRGFVPNFSIDVLEYSRDSLSFLLGNFGLIFSGILNVFFNLFLMILALFYFFRDGSRFRKHIIFLSPLSNDYDESILNRLGQAISSVVKGSLLIALLQGVLCGIGFFIFGVPNPMLFGAVAAISALVPNLGTILVLLPAIIYLFWSGALGHAIGLLIWGAVIVGLIDNLLAPHFLTHGLRVHPFLILLSVLGGLWFFGPVGFLAGPVLVTLLITLLGMYPAIVSGDSIKK